MKEELLNVLNTKLDSINKNIESLNLINTKLSEENTNLSYVEQILGYFKNEYDEYDINKFSLVEREDFDKCMELVPETTKEKFETSSCNYDGLIYLINGINNGVPLTLTDEQRDSIELMLNSLGDKKIEYQARIDGILLAKEGLEVSDENVLDTSKNKYQTIVEELKNEQYVSETDEIMSAIDYSHLEEHETVDILSYLLKYNADVYTQEQNPVFHNPSFDTLQDVPSEEDNNLQEEVAMETNLEEMMPEVPVTQEFDTLPEEPALESTELPVEPISEPLTDVDTNLIEPTAVLNEQEVNEVQETVSEPVELNTLVEEGLPVAEENNAVEDAPVENNEVEMPEVSETKEEVVPMSEEELKGVYEEYHLKLEDNYDKALLNGNVNNYKEILNNLRDQDMLSTISKNDKLLTSILTSSNNDLVNSVLDIVRNDLSIDDEDYIETAKITIDTLPAIFSYEPTGSYNNFIKNIDMFKRLDFDLINLFDFSRELLVIDNELLEKNYQLVSKYELRLDEKNAKYLLALPNVVEKIDYYMEAVYEDNITRKTFDGENIVKTYPSKLDTVCDLTIKRLRYSSENGKKMFGSRENSIAGEVANLKVDVLEIPDHYFATFFNNEFNDITNEEVLSYKQMLENNSNYEFVEDEVLQQLNTYRDGMRYIINGINVSYNKVLRIYNILVNNNVEKTKALEFAVCYNLVITKDEYMKLMETLNA